MNRDARGEFKSDFDIDHRAPLAERGAATPKRLAENKHLDAGTTEDHLAALIAECNRQIAEHRWGNALETYRQIASEFPGSPAAAQLGVRLSSILLSEGTSAARAERLDDAVMLFGMRKLLPPVPAETIRANDQGERPPRNFTPGNIAGSAALTEPPRSGSSVRPEMTSTRSSEPSNGSREAAAEATYASRSPPLPSSAQSTASDEVRVRHAFEQFLSERQQTPMTPRDREKLFVEFKNSLANGLAGTFAPTSPGKEGTRRIEIWQAVETTNLRELASAQSTVVGTVVQGSTFRVIGRSEDGKWLKIETRDGLSGYCWAARAREMR
jgi:hypothetical protein